MASKLTRRGFLKAGVFSGVAVRIGFLASSSGATVIEDNRNGHPVWFDKEGRPRFRYRRGREGHRRQILFARLSRPRHAGLADLRRAMPFLSVPTRVDRAFDGIDLSLLGDALKPDRLVLGDDLVRDGLAPPDGELAPAPGFYGDMFLVPRGRTPRLFGQPLALLIYQDFARCDAARRRIALCRRSCALGRGDRHQYAGALRRRPVCAHWRQDTGRSGCLRADRRHNRVCRLRRRQCGLARAGRRWGSRPRGRCGRRGKSSARSPVPATTGWC